MLRAAAAGSVLGALAACNSPPVAPPGPAEPASASSTAPAADRQAMIVRGNAHWRPAAWADLPGWREDDFAGLWTALLRSCARPAADWRAVCAEAASAGPPAFSDAAARDWFERWLRPYRVESPEGAADGLATGYFEPLIEASRQPRGAYRVPIYARPADLDRRKPYWTRRQIDALPAARMALRDRALAYVADPLDALVLQVQGSGRLDLVDAAGRHQRIRIAFAGHNDQPYHSVGRWLIEQGELSADEASWPAIKAWARRNPTRIDEMLWSNPRTVFFREEALPDPDLGPTGAAGVALTPGRSVAVDPRAIPYGTPVWLDTTAPLGAEPLRRLAIAQDTGSAITGAVRVDYFWGWGETAENAAGRMKQPLHLWVLWPKR